jgi:hypothetical protein
MDSWKDFNEKLYVLKVNRKHENFEYFRLISNNNAAVVCSGLKEVVIVHRIYNIILE